MGPSRQASPSWCATFCRRALHGHWVVSARCWTRPCFQGLGDGWVWMGSKNRRSPATFQKTKQWTWIFAGIWVTKSTHIFCCHQQNPWSMVSFDGVFPQSLPRFPAVYSAVSSRPRRAFGTGFKKRLPRCCRAFWRWCGKRCRLRLRPPKNFWVRCQVSWDDLRWSKMIEEYPLVMSK